MRCSERVIVALGLALVAAGGLSVPREAHAWTLNYDPPRRIAGATLGFRVNYQNCPATLDSLLGRAFDIWNGVPSSYLKVELQGSTGTTGAQIVAGTHSDFAIVCETSYQSVTSSDPNLTLAVATSSTDADGNIARGGMIINVQTAVFTSASEDQQVLVLAHEMAHVFGIGHSSDPKAIMYFQVRSSGAKPTIAQDDVDAVTFLYPRNELGGDEQQGKLFGCSTIEGAGGGGFGGPGMTNFFAFFGLVWLACQALKRRART